MNGCTIFMTTSSPFWSLCSHETSLGQYMSIRGSCTSPIMAFILRKSFSLFCVTSTNFGPRQLFPHVQTEELYFHSADRSTGGPLRRLLWLILLCSQYSQAKYGTLSKADTSLNRTVALVPRVSALERVDCVSHLPYFSMSSVHLKWMNEWTLLMCFYMLDFGVKAFAQFPPHHYQDFNPSLSVKMQLSIFTVNGCFCDHCWQVLVDALLYYVCIMYASWWKTSENLFNIPRMPCGEYHISLS